MYKGFNIRLPARLRVRRGSFRGNSDDYRTSSPAPLNQLGVMVASWAALLDGPLRASRCDLARDVCWLLLGMLMVAPSRVSVVVVDLSPNRSPRNSGSQHFRSGSLSVRTLLSGLVETNRLLLRFAWNLKESCYDVCKMWILNPFLDVTGCLNCFSDRISEMGFHFHLRRIAFE